VAAALACFAVCWTGLALERVLDTGSQVGVASVPLVVALAVLGAWAERARETRGSAEPGERVRVSAGGSPQSQVTGQVSGGLVIGPGAVFNLRGQEGDDEAPLRDEAGIGGGILLVGDVPQEPEAFQPRAGLMKVLEREPGSRASVVFAVTGLPGVGKTQVAAAYARRRIADRWRLVAWVDATDRASVLAGLGKVAAAGGIDAAGGDATEVAEGVRHWLEADGERRLVVFDNAADLDGLRPFVPSAGAAQVVITSNRQSAAGLGTPVPMGEFTEDEALQFLAERVRPGDPAGGRELAAELGFLPLALAQAAGVISARGLDYGTYLERLRTLSAEEYLVREEGRPYPRGAAESVLLSLDAVRAADQAGASTTLMEFLAVLSPSGVRRDLLRAAEQARSEPAGPDQVDEALGLLHERSLLAFNVGEQKVTVHRLVMRVVRDMLARQGRLAEVCREAGSVLEARAKASSGSFDRDAAHDVVEQALALLISAARTGDTVDDDLLMLRYYTASHMHTLAYNLPQAVAVAEKLAADSERRFGQDNPGTLEAENILALAYQDMGRYDEAIALLEQVLADRKQLLEPGDRSILYSYTNLGNAYQDVGRDAEAIPLHERALEGHAPDDPDRIAVLNNLATAYYSVDRTAEAIALLEQAIDLQQQLAGEEAPDTLLWQGNLGMLFCATGRYREAVTLLEQVVEAQGRIVGSSHPHTLLSRANLSAAYRLAGRRDEAMALLEQVVDDRERIQGPSHPHTIKARENLSSLRRGELTWQEFIAQWMRDPESVKPPGTHRPPRPRRWLRERWR